MEKCQGVSRRDSNNCLFSFFVPFTGGSHSFPTSFFLNGRTGATKTKLQLATLLVTSALLIVELLTSKVILGCLSKPDHFRSSTKIKYSLSEDKTDPNPRATCWTLQSTWINSVFEGVFWQTRQQKLQLARFGLENFSLRQTQKCLTYGQELPQFQFQDS